MDRIAWATLLQQVVLVGFSVFFVGVVAWTYAPAQRDLEALGALPFEPSERPVGREEVTRP